MVQVFTATALPLSGLKSRSTLIMVNDRRELPNRREHTTQKVRIGDQRTLYITVHDDPRPAEIFLRVKGPDCSSELIGLYDVIARLMSLALQYGAPLEQVGDLLAGAKFAPCGQVSGHDHIKHCTSLPDLIGRHVLVEYCGREDLAHVSASVRNSEPPRTTLSNA
jgi:ribonucleoside-diphosphate reductase alpha chain